MPLAWVVFMIVVTPFLLVVKVVIDFSMPEPWIVVPAGRFGHVADVISNSTGKDVDLRRCSEGAARYDCECRDRDDRE